LYDSKNIESVIHGLNSIGMLIETTIDEEDEDIWNKPMNTLTEAEFNKLAKAGKI
jgi:hypothetical protein